MTNWRISWHDLRNPDSRRGNMYVTGADEAEIAMRVDVMKDFPTLEDVRAEVVTDEEWAAIRTDQSAYIVPTHRITP